MSYSLYGILCTSSEGVQSILHTGCITSTLSTTSLALQTSSLAEQSIALHSVGVLLLFEQLYLVSE